MTDAEAAKARLAALLAKQEQERHDLTARLLAEQDAAAARLRAEFDTEVGSALADALTDAERRLRAEVRTDSVRARIEDERERARR